MRLATSKLCTGCGACVNACPFDALSMKTDAEGFLQPVVDQTKCKECGKCTQSCPIVTTVAKPEQIEKKPLCGCSNSDEVWRASASGGAFSEICAAFSGQNPIIFGARFEGVSKVVHAYVEGVEQIAPFRKSKYVQSDVGLAFRECRRFLEEGRMVIFSGTPCQIAGLRGYLSKDYKNLITLEFICHGSGSPGFFEACLREQEKKFGKKIVEYQFRHKLKNAQIREQYLSFYRFFDGSARVVPIDLYNKFFLSQLCLRKSCMERCSYRNESRYSDITYADCRGEKTLYPDKDEKNWSVIIANTKKGEEIVEKLKSRMLIKEYPVELLRTTNPLYYRTTPGNPNRDEFFRRYVAGEEIVKIGKRLGVIAPMWKVVGLKIKSVVRCLLKK